jgi:hypothetical protein
VLISHSHKFIFIHIVKAAGSSVNASLTPYAQVAHMYLLNKIFRHLHLPLGVLPAKYRPLPYPVHIWARRLRDQIPREQFDTYFKFTFTRNPWDWQVSLYHWYVDHPEHCLHETIKDMSFSDYVEWRSQTPIQYYQKDYVTDEKGRLIIDFVGKFENLRADFADICERLGIKTDLHGWNITASRAGRDYRAYYTDRSREIIGGLYKRDVEFFEYSFE